jgi:hypothetical protein
MPTVSSRSTQWALGFWMVSAAMAALTSSRARARRLDER